MNWLDYLDRGGAWAVVLGIGYALLKGQIRLGREVASAETRCGEIETTWRERWQAEADRRKETEAELRGYHTDAGKLIEQQTSLTRTVEELAKQVADFSKIGGTKDQS